MPAYSRHVGSLRDGYCVFAVINTITFSAQFVGRNTALMCIAVRCSWALFTDCLRPIRCSLHYWYLIVSILMALHASSLLHFPLLHFQRPRIEIDIAVTKLAMRQTRWVAGFRHCRHQQWCNAVMQPAASRLLCVAVFVIIRNHCVRRWQSSAANHIVDEKFALLFARGDSVYSRHCTGNSPLCTMTVATGYE